MRLIYAAYADFRRNELTLARECLAKNKLTMGPNDVMHFISKGGDQYVWVFREEAFNNLSGEGSEHGVLQSRRFRITYGGTWTPYMLKNYGAQAGFDISNRKLFEEQYEAMRKQKLKERKKRMQEQKE